MYRSILHGFRSIYFFFEVNFHVPITTYFFSGIIPRILDTDIFDNDNDNDNF